jgi:hypothetical protein
LAVYVWAAYLSHSEEKTQRAPNSSNGILIPPIPAKRSMNLHPSNGRLSSILFVFCGKFILLKIFSCVALLPLILLSI